ncbi:hypothetical protein [Archangium sp.]|uniref:hypothetical protein n=1 Tax=Archangium sp. TaxID=1872627 RepID=UPI00389A7906
MSEIDPRALADWILEQMRKPRDPNAEARQEAFEALKAARLHVWHIRKGRKPATARTRAEMEFAAGLEPCPTCGHRGIRSTELTGAGSSWTLTATCPSCGTARSFTYATEGDPTQAPPHGADELSHLPSFLIPAESFQAELQRLLPLSRGDPAALQRALVCANELIKLTEPHSATRTESSHSHASHAKLTEPHGVTRTESSHSHASHAHQAMAAYERVLAEPSSLSARQALAIEWSTANDSRAELIERQLRLRKYRLEQTLWADEAVKLSRELNVLVRRHGKLWAGEVAPLVKSFAFHRGCLAEVTLSGAAFLTVMPKLVKLAPVQHVNLIAPLEFAAVVASPLLARMTSLQLIELGAGFGDAEVKLLAGSEHARNLRWVRLFDNAIGEAGVVALAASTHLASCVYLGLDGNPVDVTPRFDDSMGFVQPVRSYLAEELEKKYGPRPWLTLPEADALWPPDRDDVSTTA